jgi:deoxyribodipyrimidine photo-lyase
MLDLSQNIPDIKIFVGEFSEFKAQVGSSVVHYQEHPTCTHYQGHSYPKETLHPIQGYYPSFFKYWKKCTQYRIALDEKGEIF